MLEQEEWEPNDSFSSRLHAVLETLDGDSPADHTVLFVAGMYDDAMTVAGRFETAVTLLSYLSRLDSARLVLTRGYGPPCEEDEELSSFASELGEEWDSPSVEVSVRPRRARLSSQIRAA